MTRCLRLFCLSVLCLAVPAVAEAQWDTPNRAFHKATALPLEGRHLTVPCASCHLNGVTKGTPKSCESCHWERRQDDVYRLRLGSNCAQCHTATAWTAVKWNHAASTGTALNAAHKTVACDSCHKNAQFTTARVSCLDCHRADYEATRNPSHRATGFSTACESCHKPSDTLFTQARFNHAVVFPLVGLHGTAACATCHVGEKYTGTPRDCVGCHRREYDQTKNPSHAAAGYATTCDSCHKATDATWLQATVNHAQFFPLVGVHTTAACTSCHKNSVYKGTARDCYTCHKTNYDQTKSPNHAAAGYSTTCDSCHKATDATWLLAVFNHTQFYPLVGLHATAACTSCHVNNIYKGTSRVCYACHKTVYDQTKSPSHVAAGFGTTCDSCHKNSDTSWTLGKFNHTGFPITSGKHAGIACATCHTNATSYSVFTCMNGCHNKTTTDNQHKGRSGYQYVATACYSCHPQGRS